MRKSYKDIINLIPDNRKFIAQSLCEELDFLATTLKELRKTIKAKGVVENFKNGKQEFMRESPALRSYNNSIQRYATLMKQLEAIVPEDKVNEASELMDFLNKYNE